MKFDDLRAHFKALIESKTELTVYFERADANAQYPYITFDLQENYSTETDVYNYNFICDGWDIYTPKNIIKAFDQLDKELKNYHHLHSSFLAICSLGSREFVEDEDKDIRHLLRTYDLKVYDKDL